jgi:hypothetical protein
MRRFVDNSGLLITGALTALVWANIHHASYQQFAEALHFVVNDVAMVFFFALATKEVVEATAAGGALYSPRRALVPMLAAVGGMAGRPPSISRWRSLAACPNCCAAGRLRVRPTSPSATSSRDSSCASRILPSRFFFCWPSRTTR